MLILSRVCAEFHDRSGAAVFTVTPSMRLTFVEAPESIREDPLFQMLINDRSIEVSDNIVRKKQLENDPELPEENKPAEESRSAAKKPAEKKG